jgi:uncharacterized glyoxalase superfamily protein PhnB
MEEPMPVKPAIIPCLRYRDAQGAITFLCDAFGFERHAVFADDKDPSVVHHAQLVRNGCMIMLSSIQDSDYAAKAGMKTVAEAGGNTQAPYLVIDDVDAHADRARAAGAEIFFEPADQDYGGRVYSARDPEGNAWSFGSYDPWAPAA